MLQNLVSSVPALLTSTSSTVAPIIDVSNVQFGQVFSEITNLIPVLIPVAIGFLAVRKGISFMMSMLKGA